jgi:hypothetical protein
MNSFARKNISLYKAKKTIKTNNASTLIVFKKIKKIKVKVKNLITSFYKKNNKYKIV